MRNAEAPRRRAQQLDLLQKILWRQDRRAGENGEHFVELVEGYIEWDPVIYVANARVDRTLRARGVSVPDPLLSPMFASLWIDGFLAGIEFGRTD